MTRAAVGIDPGKTGGVVALVMDDAGIRCVYQALTHQAAPDLTPWLMHEVIAAASAAVLAAQVCPIVYVLERVGAMPKQGLSSTFNFGHGRGVWRGILAGWGECIEPTPQVWARAMLANIPGAGKAKAIARASQITGLTLIPPGCRVPQDGLADACCLALYGLRGQR